MTRENLKQLKLDTIKRMNAALDESKKLSEPVEDYCGIESIEEIRISRKDTDEEIREKMVAIQKLSEEPGTIISLHGSTHPIGRHDYFDAVIYRFTKTIVREEITDSMIEKEVKSYVKDALGISEFDILECKVMQLFKDGNIEWEDVVKAHEKDCEI